MDQQFFFGIDFGVMRVMCWPGWCGKKSVCWRCGEQGVFSGRRVHLLDAGFWSTCGQRGLGRGIQGLEAEWHVEGISGGEVFIAVSHTPSLSEKCARAVKSHKQAMELSQDRSIKPRALVGKQLGQSCIPGFKVTSAASQALCLLSSTVATLSRMFASKDPS